MLKAIQAGRLNVAPQETEEVEGDDGETIVASTGDTPFPNHRGFRQELSYDDGEEFDIREKVPADFADLSPQQAGKVAKQVERLLAEQNPHFEYVEDGDGDGDGDEPAAESADED